MNGVVQLVPGLYAIGPQEPGAATYVYYLLAKDQEIDPIPTLKQMLTELGLNGWFVFTGGLVTEPDQFKKQARASFPNLSQWEDEFVPRGIVWLPDPGNPSAYKDSLVCRKNAPFPTTPQTLDSDHTFLWSGFGLKVTTKVNVGFNAANSSLELKTGEVSDVQILYNGVNQTVSYYSPPNGWLISLPLVAPVPGSLQFSIALDQGTLQKTFGCTFSYVFGNKTGYTTLSYPLFAPAKPAQPQNYLGFNFRLHPLHPLDFAQTRLALDLLGESQYAANSRKLKSAYFNTVNGGTMVFVPVDPGPPSSSSTLNAAAAGFGFCKAPAPNTPQAEPVYSLAPAGMFRLQQITPPASAEQSEVPADADTRWMCGLFGQEFLTLSVQDAIEFVSNSPAYAPGFSTTGHAGEASGDALTGLFTTSWMRLLDGSPHAYYAQPSSSVYYAAAPEDTYPTAVDSLLSSFAATPTLPIVPYGGVFAAAQPGGAPASAASPSLLAAFESSVLSSVRHAALSIPGRGPVFQSSKPVMAAVPSHLKSRIKRASDIPLGSAAPTALTPQGLLVNLNTQGQWEAVVLAQSPDDPNVYLQFTAASGSSTVSAQLSSMLVQNELFLVVRKPEPLGTFESFLKISGFNFNLQVGAADTLLVFKYNTSLSLRDLTESSTLWADSSVFVGDAEAIAAAQEMIRNAISTAEAEADIPGQPFAYFNKIVNQASWTGILAFHCAIDGNGMPPDLQILLGGIQGRLRAHHFGIETNRVLPSSGGALSIGRSSLFGVIHYENPKSAAGPVNTDFAYAVETLTVVFSNSKISQLATSVGLTINRLFEREVSLIAGTSSPDISNTLIIKGQYQTQGGVGTVLFSADTAFIYAFPRTNNATRVIDRGEINHASLVPVYSNPIASPHIGTAVRASFALSGELWFLPEPFPDSDGLDLFSYGNPATGGLSFSGLTVYIDFQLDATGSLLPGSESVTLQPALLSFAPSNAAIRPHALLKSLPLDYSRFWYSTAGLSATALGALPLNCLQLEDRGTVASPGVIGPFPYVTPAPHYALEFDLPLGTLGSLSDIGVGLMAKLLIGWGPSTVVPDNDAAAVFVQLPSVFGGIDGFTLQGILRTTFGDANLLMVDVNGAPVYAILFNNIKFSVLGFSFPPGVMIDFVIFAGQPATGEPVNGSNIAWFLAAQPVPKKPDKAQLMLPAASVPLLEAAP